MSRLFAILAIVLVLSGCAASLKATDLDGSINLTEKEKHEEAQKTSFQGFQAQLYQKCCTGEPEKYA